MLDLRDDGTSIDGAAQNREGPRENCSLRGDGGRLNIGAEPSPSAFTPFPALYFTEDYGAACNSTMFGRLTLADVLHGIVYPSTKLAGKRCMALITQN